MGARSGDLMHGRSERVAPGERRHIDGRTGHERAVTVQSGRLVYRLNSDRTSTARGLHTWCRVGNDRELLPVRELADG
jgi:hypothetical protein